MVFPRRAGELAGCHARVRGQEGGGRGTDEGGILTESHVNIPYGAGASGGAWQWPGKQGLGKCRRRHSEPHFDISQNSIFPNKNTEVKINQTRVGSEPSSTLLRISNPWQLNGLENTHETAAAFLVACESAFLALCKYCRSCSPSSSPSRSRHDPTP